MDWYCPNLIMLRNILDIVSTGDNDIVETPIKF
jgi:hypothetical protein